MKFSLASTLVVALTAETALASSWFSKAAYNKWHETELERWLSDHNVKYPTPADRKDLENLVKDSWTGVVESPYANWDTKQLQKQLEAQGVQVQKSAEKNKDSLVNQVKSSWSETVDSANTAYGDVKSWIFDSWTDSTIKAFADKHGIPVPQPRRRDQLLKAVRENYQTAAKRAGETAAYPGNWLYAQWSESDLKAWLDARGIPAPQPSSRDKLIASVRRNARVAGLNSQKYTQDAASSLSASADSAKQTLTDEILSSWSESQLKEFFDKNGIKVPQGSTKNELIAIARKNAAKLTGDNVSNSAAKAYGAASSSAAKAYDAASSSGAKAYGAASSSGASAYGAASSSGVSAYGAATSSAGNEYAKATASAYSQYQGVLGQAQSVANHYYTEAQIALGFRANYASSVSSAYAQASKSVKAEL